MERKAQSIQPETTPEHVGEFTADSNNVGQPDRIVDGSYPLLPLRGNVLFPGNVSPVFIEDPGTLQAIQETLPTRRELVLAALREPEVENPVAGDFFEVGVLARVLQMMPKGVGLVLVVEAQERARILEFTNATPISSVKIELIESSAPPAEDEYWQAALRNLAESAIRLVRNSASIPDEAEAVIRGLTDGRLLVDFLAGNVGMPLEEKQELLEQTNAVHRLERIQKFLNNQLHITELQEKLRQDVQSEFGEAQRRAYLREQLRAIQKELGEDDGSDEKIAELKARLDGAKLPETAQAHVQRELQRLEHVPPSSPEYSGIVDYLETVAGLPWSTLSAGDLDLERAERILERDHYGIQKIKQRILQYLSVKKLNPTGRGPILCFLGPPGVGKTSLGESVAEALGRKFARIALGGIRDEAEIRGHRRTYIGSMPGRLIQELRRVGTRDPVIMLDEIDKIGADFRGDPASALLEVLDSRQNHAFVDRYLDVPFDLSQVVFIATANLIDPVPQPLEDRMEVIELHGYTLEEKQHIAEKYLIPRQLEENGLTSEQCRWQKDAIAFLIASYTREAGVRNLEREIGAVIRTAAAGFATGTDSNVIVDPDRVEAVLGPPRVMHEDKLAESTPGVVNGLAYTPFGGDVLHIEAIRYAGTGQLVLTGQLGDVMKESVKAAESLVRSRVESLGIEADAFSKFDFHVHVPAGAVPKDGPSAGVAMFTALASLFAGRAVNKDVAMTGEITLRGVVLPIGGLKEKTLAALNAGITTVLIPKLNEKDIAELPPQIREGLTIVPVATVDEVIEHALLPAV